MEHEVGFFEVETWAKLAENCYNKGHKGRGVRVVGRLKQDRWNGPDGNPRSRITIVAEHVEFRPDFRKEGAPYPNGNYEEKEAANLAEVAAEAPAEEEYEPVTF